eukprot:gene17022-biopygen2099
MSNALDSLRVACSTANSGSGGLRPPEDETRTSNTESSVPMGSGGWRQLFPCFLRVPRGRHDAQRPHPPGLPRRLPAHALIRADSPPVTSPRGHPAALPLRGAAVWRVAHRAARRQTPGMAAPADPFAQRAAT